MKQKKLLSIGVAVLAGVLFISLMSVSAAGGDTSDSTRVLTDAHETNGTEFNATNEGGEIIIGGDDGERIDLARDIVIEGTISANSTWKSSSVQFPDATVQEIPVEISDADGLEGTFDAEAGIFTIRGELVISSPLEELRLNLSASSENAAGERNLSADSPSVTVVDDTFAIAETGNQQIDEQLGLPSPSGENVLRIPLEFSLDTPDEDPAPDPPAEPVVNVTTGEDGTTSVRASVPNVSAGERVEIPVNPDTGEKDYQVENVGITPAEDTRMEMSINSSADPLASTPDTRTGFETNTTAIGNLSVNTTLPDEEVEAFEITTRVGTAQLRRWDTDPGNVSLYRFNESLDRWVEQETELLEVTDGTALLHVRTTHPSDWTVAAARPEFEISETEVEVDVARVGDSVAIDVVVENTGGTEGTYTADLLLNGEVVDSRETVIADGGDALFDFEPEFDAEGTYEVRVNDEPIQEIEVTPQEEGDGETTEEETDDPEDGDDGSGDGFGVVVAVIAVAGAALIARRNR